MAPGMTEFDLIEIAKRFRMLEDAVEETDIHLVERQERLGEHIDALEAKHSAGKLSYDAWCRSTAQPQKDLDAIMEARTNLELCLEACRDYMNAMADCIRKARG